ncbi:hypothetical protein F5884DRAFT_904594 [Xylogone sp. PMI_703]|nr:hypothetical protein F5884DRAFT_904594 [Xylogone sp. PMI_703]
MCGMYSAGGNVSCGMKLCCSFHGWCGTDAAHCGDPDPNGLEPCQEGFGACAITPPPSCGASGSSNGRTIAYYQSSNVRTRLCNRIDPAHINTTGLTHLYFAFASIDPTSFAIVPADPGDVPMYSEFTALQTPALETWIAVGGFDFSDAAAATHTTWSDLSSTASNRAAFISSLLAFMQEYGFQGVDLDWEYPANPDRGGGPADTENYVALVREMRAQFGGQYGISLTLAPDITYITGFDAIGMQPFVDWFGFMAYDLHGFWDAANPTLGAVVRGQTNIQEIFNDTLPLWFDGLDPGKINFGLAYYGRGYTLQSSTCNTLGCPFLAGSEPGTCTNYVGVMSLIEIETLIQEQGLVPELLNDIAMKQITWGNQWIAYDDADTFVLKKQFADGLCFGGTMIWSIDYNSGVGDGSIPSNPNAVNTTDGTCGIDYGGTVCGDWPQGSCCSSAGYCGNTTAHCGSGCQSGPCVIGGNTTDGTCGSAYHNTLCGDWPQGSCCSSAGYCGNTPAHCGSGCQSGPCTAGGDTTDGTCGVNFGNTVCGNWPQGSCCSSAGYCGNTTAHCGDGCQSGPCLNGGSGGSPTTPGQYQPSAFGSPDEAAINAITCTSLAPAATFTITNPCATEIAGIPASGDSNIPIGPLTSNRCDLMRLLTQTCGGSGGTLGNPILLPAGQPAPVDIMLPPGFIIPNGIHFTSREGDVITSGEQLVKQEAIPAGTPFSTDLIIPRDTSLTDEEDENESDFDDYVTVIITNTIWSETTMTVGCPFPCVIIFPPTIYPAITPTPVTLSTTISSTPFTTVVTPSVVTSPSITIPPITLPNYLTAQAPLTRSPKFGPLRWPLGKYNIGCPKIFFGLITLCPPDGPQPGLNFNLPPGPSITAPPRPIIITNGPVDPNKGSTETKSTRESTSKSSSGQECSTHTATVCTEYISSFSSSGMASSSTITETVCQPTEGCSVEASTSTMTVSTTCPACAVLNIPNFSTITATQLPFTIPTGDTTIFLDQPTGSGGGGEAATPTPSPFAFSFGVSQTHGDPLVPNYEIYFYVGTDPRPAANAFDGWCNISPSAGYPVTELRDDMSIPPTDAAIPRTVNGDCDYYLDTAEYWHSISDDSIIGHVDCPEMPNAAKCFKTAASVSSYNCLPGDTFGTWYFYCNSGAQPASGYADTLGFDFAVVDVINSDTYSSYLLFDFNGTDPEPGQQPPDYGWCYQPTTSIFNPHPDKDTDLITPPTTVTGISTHEMKNCNYTQDETQNWSDVWDNEIIGHIDCPGKPDMAKCFKTQSQQSSFTCPDGVGTNGTWFFYCMWQ